MNIIQNIYNLAQLISNGGNGAATNPNATSIQLTSTSGTRRYVWDVRAFQGKDIIVEFDYRVSSYNNNDKIIFYHGNSFTSAGTTLQTITLGNSTKHVKLNVSNLMPYIGFQLQRASGLIVLRNPTLIISNLRMYTPSVNLSKLYQTGIFQSGEFNEDDVQFQLGDSFLTSPLFYEI